MVIDLNCDVGESFGAYKIGNDAEVLDYVTSANIACGFHAGDPTTMRRTVRLAAERGVAIGAHPGLPDLVGFGRRAMEVTPQQAYDLVLYQIGALQAFVHAEGAWLRHVKPHGALYMMAERDAALAKAIAEAVARAGENLVLVGSSGSELIAAGKSLGLKTASEVFADRNYQAGGQLVSRRHPHALISDPHAAAERAVRMVKQGIVLSDEGTELRVQADTICLHGDGPHAVEFARTLRRELEAAGIEVCSTFSTNVEDTQ